VNCFFDSSALAKFYHAEPGTPEVDLLIRSPANRTLISELTVVEMCSVFAINVRTGFVLRDDALFLMHRFRRDVASRSLDAFAVGGEEFGRNAGLLDLYAFHLKLRSLDAIQLATALGLRAQGLINSFVACDKVLCEVAVREVCPS
jgi:predicted nucleic acid-binding protein